MKKLFVFIIFSTFLVPLARTVFAAPATPGITPQVTLLPVNGTMRTSETYSNASPTLLVTATGSGDATQLGRFVLSYKAEWDFLDHSTTGTAYFFTSNGDNFQAEVRGQATVDQTPGMYNVIEIYTITGGTGQFEGASGTLTLKRQVNLATGATTGTFEGTLLIP
jgi:hypothetical protein